MTTAEIMSATGCSLEVAREVIAKRPGNDSAQVALARLKMPTQKVQKAAAPLRPHDQQCDACGKYKRPSNFAASRGICRSCARH